MQLLIEPISPSLPSRSKFLQSARGDYQSAISYLHQALSASRRKYHRIYLGALAETYALMGDTVPAIAYYRQAVESPRHSSPNMIRFHYHLGLPHEEMGDLEFATQSSHRFSDFWKDADPDLSPLADARNRLRSFETQGSGLCPANTATSR